MHSVKYRVRSVKCEAYGVKRRAQSKVSSVGREV